MLLHNGMEQIKTIKDKKGIQSAFYGWLTYI